MSGRGRLENGDTIRFEGSLQGTAAQAWEHLTSATLLPVWFGSEGMEFAIEPRMGGAVRLMDGNITGAVKEWRPGVRLAYSWNLAGIPAPETLVSFDLAGKNGRTSLTLTQTPVGPSFAAASLSGWHAFLDRLEAMLAGRDPGDVMAAMGRHRAAYLAEYPEPAMPQGH